MRLDPDLVVVATRNPGKVKEFAHRFGKIGVAVRSLADYDGIPDIVEDGVTFAANAEIKAKTIAQALRLPVLADDSGLCVDALEGRPGVYSARYAGEHASDADNNRKLLRELNELAERGALQPGETRIDGMAVRLLSPARFVCALAVHDPESGRTMHWEGRCEGAVIDVPLGENGFGYDPLFYLPEFGRTMAQLSLEEKNAVSHRAKALERLFAEWNRGGIGFGQ